MGLFSALTIVLIIVLAFLALRAWFDPGIGLTLICAMYALEQVLQPQFPMLRERTWLLNVLLTLIACGSVLSNFYRGGLQSFRITFPLVCYVLLIGLSFASFYWSPNQVETWSKLKESIPYLVAFTIIAPMTVVNGKQLSSAFLWTMVLGFIVLVMLSSGETGVRGLVFERVQGKSIESNPLASSSYGGMVGICAIFSLYTSRSGWAKNILKVAMVLMSAYVIYRSGSRGQLVAFAATLFVLLPLAARITLNRQTIIGLVFGFAGVLLAIVLIDQSDIIRDENWRVLRERWRLEQIEKAQGGRIEMCLTLFQHYQAGGPFTWLFGLGNSSAFHYVGFYPHVVPVEVLCEEGLVGFALFSLFFGTVYFKGLRLLFEKVLDVDTRINLGILLALLTFNFILSLKQGSLVGSPLMFCYGLVAGQMIQRLESARRKFPQAQSSASSARVSALPSPEERGGRGLPVSNPGRSAGGKVFDGPGV